MCVSCLPSVPLCHKVGGLKICMPTGINLAWHCNYWFLLEYIVANLPRLGSKRELNKTCDIFPLSMKFINIKARDLVFGTIIAT